MLRKDNENVTKEMKTKFPKEYDLIKNKKQVVFKLVNSIHDGKKKQPRSYSFPPQFATQDEDGNTQEFLYYTTTKKKSIGNVVIDEFSPGLLTFSSRGDLVVNLVDEHGVFQNFDLFILLMNHPRRAKNKYGDGKKRPIFYLEDKNAEAKERVESESATAQMKKLIYDPEHRLGEEDLRTIGRALRVPSVDDMELALVQTSIEDYCKTNPQKFLSFKGVGKEVKMRANLQKAADKGIIKYNALKRKWELVNESTKKTVTIAPVRQTENEMEALMSWLKNIDTEDTYAKIMELETGKIQPLKEKSESADAEKTRLLLAENENLKLQLELANKGNKSVDTEGKKDGKKDGKEKVGEK